MLPALLFKRSFRSYVLATFRVNGVAAMPVLYRLAEAGTAASPRRGEA